jgi:hypothetical protein
MAADTAKPVAPKVAPKDDTKALLLEIAAYLRRDIRGAELAERLEAAVGVPRGAAGG